MSIVLCGFPLKYGTKVIKTCCQYWCIIDRIHNSCPETWKQITMEVNNMITFIKAQVFIKHILFLVVKFKSRGAVNYVTLPGKKVCKMRVAFTPRSPFNSIFS